MRDEQDTTPRQASATLSERALLASVKSVAMVRTVRGTRQLRLTVRAGEPATMKATLTRGGRAITTRTVLLADGSQLVKLSVPETTEPGFARLRVLLSDASGHTRSYQRKVQLRPMTEVLATAA